MIAQVCPSVNPSARIYYIFARNFYIKRLNHFSCGIGVKQGVRGSVRTGMLFAAISTGGSAKALRCKGCGYPDDDYFFLKLFDVSWKPYIRNPSSHSFYD